MILISILILFFMLLLSYQIIITLFPLKEGLKIKGRETVSGSESDSGSSSAVYQPYNSDALSNSEIALPKQNATNIEYLNGIISNLNKSNTKNEQSINSMQTQIDALTQQQVEYATSIGTPAPAEE